MQELYEFDWTKKKEMIVIKVKKGRIDIINISDNRWKITNIADKFTK